MGVVVIDVLHQDGFELTSVDDQHSVETLSADGPNESLSEGVCPGRPKRALDDPDVLGAEDLVEARGELRVTVSKEESGWSGAVTEVHAQVAGLLGDPLPHWIGSDARKVDPAGIDLNEEQHVQAPK
jgi:hypothetical protein